MPYFIAMPGRALFLFAALLLCSESAVPFAAADERLLQQNETRRWYRGNMHTHSLWSDGDDYPEMIAAWYKDHGYQFLVFTDHNVLHRGERWIDIEKNKGGIQAFEKLRKLFPDSWVETRVQKDRRQVRLKTFDEVFDRLAVPQKYLLIQGEEITDRFRNLPVHLCATNVYELLPPLGGESVTEVIERNVNAAVARRERTGIKTLVHLNHPNFGFAVTAEQLMPVAAERFFEVYNGHPSVYNSGDKHHASTERIWDIINTWRLARLQLPLMFGLATDDGHNYHKAATPGVGSQPGRGWVMVLAETLTPDALVDALEAGSFYASTGVTLKSIAISDSRLSVTVEPQEGVTYEIRFIGTRKDFDDSTRPAVDDPARSAQMTRVYSQDVGAVLKSVQGTQGEYRFQGDELYVRAVVTSSRKHPNPSEPGDFEMAWVQPVTPPSADSNAAGASQSADSE